ncbi:MAG: hypothetical protein JWR59_1455 [Brevundimonas sp.]|nr:hypothetical protein [Brevundimonas sp.]
MIRFNDWADRAGNAVMALLLGGLLAGMVGFVIPSL